jgi:hypothetical protein
MHMTQAYLRFIHLVIGISLPAKDDNQGPIWPERQMKEPLHRLLEV